MLEGIQTIFAGKTSLEVFTIIGLFLKVIYHAESYIASYFQKIPIRGISYKFIILNMLWLTAFISPTFPLRPYVLAFFLLAFFANAFNIMTLRSDLQREYIPGYFAAILLFLTFFIFYFQNLSLK